MTFSLLRFLWLNLEFFLLLKLDLKLSKFMEFESLILQRSSRKKVIARKPLCLQTDVDNIILSWENKVDLRIYFEATYHLLSNDIFEIRVLGMIETRTLEIGFVELLC